MGLELVRAITGSREGMALATVIAVRGSAPRHPGAKLLFCAGGGVLGTVGGGRGEARALLACRDCLEDGRAALLQVPMVGNEIQGPEMVCGGTSITLIEPLADRGPYRAALERLARGERVLFVKGLTGQGAGPVTVAVALLDQDGTPAWGRVDGASAALAARALELGCPWYDEEASVFYDPVLPEEKLLILGAGHVGQALAALAPAVGFAVTVVDDRPELLDRGRYPEEVRTVRSGFPEAIADFPFDRSASAVVLTRGHQQDLECVRALLARSWRYAGFMGSARKTRLVLDQVLQDGFDPARVAALSAPIGLDIGAETPAELAVAILGELVAVRRNAAILPALALAREARRA